MITVCVIKGGREMVDARDSSKKAIACRIYGTMLKPTGLFKYICMICVNTLYIGIVTYDRASCVCGYTYLCYIHKGLA